MDTIVKEEVSKIPEECKGAAKSSNYICYILRSKPVPARTYSGSSNHFAHRIRQHNGLITGGARATQRDKPWLVCALVYGFLTKKAALRFEFFTKVKHSKTVYMAALRGRRDSIQRRACLLIAAERQMTREQQRNLKYFVPDAYMVRCLEDARAQGLPGTLDQFVKDEPKPVHADSPSTKASHSSLESTQIPSSFLKDQPRLLSDAPQQSAPS